MTDIREAREAIVYAHKQAHGLTTESAEWDDPRWETEWRFDVPTFIAALSEAGMTICREHVTYHCANGEPVTATRKFVPVSED